MTSTYEKLNPEGLNLWNVWVRKPKNILILAFAAAFNVVAATTILAKANVISFGLSGLVSVIVYSNKALLLPYFSLLLFLLNLPVLLAFTRLLPSKMLILTFYWLFFQLLFQSFYKLTGFDQILNRFSLFDVANNRAWDVEKLEDRETWPILIYGLIGGILATVATAFCWRFGGSSGGIDIIIAYFVFRYKKPIGRINILTLLAFFGLALITDIIFQLQQQSLNLPKFFTKVLTNSLLIIISGNLFNLIFPKYTKVLMRIHSIDYEAKIILELERIRYWHAYNRISCATRVRTNASYIETVCLYLEVGELVKIVRKIDPKAFIFLVPIKGLYGRFNTKTVE